MNQKGQGLIEYLIIVCLVAIATMGVFRVLSQTLSSRFASVTYTLQGRSRKAAPVSEVQDSHLRKKDLSDFFVGASSGEQ